MQPNLTAVEIQLLKQLNERDSQVLDGRPRPLGADRLEELGYIKVHTLNLQDLLYSITPAGRTALAAIDPEDYGLSTVREAAAGAPATAPPD